MLMFQLPTYKPGKNGLDKAKAVVHKLKDRFGLKIIFGRSEMILRSKGFYCRKNDLGVMETSRAEFRMYSKSFRLYFKCEDESGHLYPELFSERTIRLLMTAFTHPHSFEIFMIDPKNEEKVGTLSDII